MAESAILQSYGYQTLVGAASLAVGPFVMAVGDLLHPEESSDVGDQAAIIVEHATRWYLAHLLLLVGFVLLVPGLLTLTGLAAARRPRAGYWARVLVVIGAAGVASIFVAEMLAGRLGSDHEAATEDFLDTMFSGPIAGPLMPVAMAFFVGVAVFAVPMIADPGPLRWPAAVLLAGVLLIVAEIISSQVILSQIGNVLVWISSVAFAWLLLRGDAERTTRSTLLESAESRQHSRHRAAYHREDRHPHRTD